MDLKININIYLIIHIQQKYRPYITKDKTNLKIIKRKPINIFILIKLFY